MTGSVSDYKHGAVITAARLAVIPLYLRDPHISSLDQSDRLTFVFITCPD